MNKVNPAGFVSFIVVAIVIILGGGWLYYKKTNTVLPLNPESPQAITGEIKKPFFSASKVNMSPKELFVARNSELYSAKNLDDMLSVIRTYDDSVQIKEAESLFENTDEKERGGYFVFAKSALIPTDDFVMVTESVKGESAIVVARTQKNKEITAVFVKQGSSWKLRSEEVRDILKSKNAVLYKR